MCLLAHAFVRLKKELENDMRRFFGNGEMSARGDEIWNGSWD